MMALRIAWFKVYKPLAYYCAYFSERAASFDVETMSGTCEGIVARMNALKNKVDGETASEAKRRNEMVIVLEVVLEMRRRGIDFLPVDVYASHASRFQIEDGNLRPSLDVLEGVGEVAAQAIEKARESGPFLSIEDMVRRSRVSSAVVAAFKKYNSLAGLPATDQVSLFSLV